MPNILIVGFSDEENETIRGKILYQLKPVVEDLSEVVCTPVKTNVLDGNEKNAPYLVVRSSADYLDAVVQSLEVLGIDMEVELPLYKFIPGTKKPEAK